MHDEDKMKRLTAFAADLLTRIEALTAERDEAINQLDSAIHSQIVLEKRTAAVMQDRNLILEERDRTFALMLARADKAEADNARLRAAFRVNMLRLIPGVTHADIDAAISAALTGKEPT